jgi:hypothetical protein
MGFINSIITKIHIIIPVIFVGRFRQRKLSKNGALSAQRVSAV